MESEEATLRLPEAEPAAARPLVAGDGTASSRVGVQQGLFQGAGDAAASMAGVQQTLFQGALDELFEQHCVELRARVVQLLGEHGCLPDVNQRAVDVDSHGSAGALPGQRLPHSEAPGQAPSCSPSLSKQFQPPAIEKSAVAALSSLNRRMAGLGFSQQTVDPRLSTSEEPAERRSSKKTSTTGVATWEAPSTRHSTRKTSSWKGGVGRCTETSATPTGNWSSQKLEHTTQAAWLLHSPYFDTVIGIVSLISGILVGLDVEYCASHLLDTPPVFFELVLYIFCTIFAGELILRIYVEGHDFYRGPEKWWNLFDTVTVVFNILEAIMMNAFPALRPVLSFSRLVRIVRVVRVVRVFRFLAQLKLMMFSIMSTIKALGWSSVIMIFWAYFCSVSLTQAATHHMVDLARDGRQPDYLDDLKDNWGSLARTGYTLFKSVMGGVSWGEPLASLLMLHPVYFLIFVFYISFTLFAFFNVMTGFFCEKAVDFANQDKELVIQEQLDNKAQYIEEFQRLFSSIDEDGSGDLSYDEFESNLNSDELKAYFLHLHLDINRAHDIFRLLDMDQSGTVSVAEFVEGCLQLRGQATKVDIASVGYEVVKLQQLVAELHQREV